jgi:adenylate kinase family enzyme
MTRLHITGASGAGTTTLGRALAQRFAVPHFDTDDFFWLPTDPPYQQQRDAARRLALLEELMGERRGWVLSGSLMGWGDPLIRRFDLVVWLDAPTEVRLARLVARERARYGRAAIAPGGAMHAEHHAFLDWAASYDTRTDDGRGRARHRQWLAALPCPVVRLDGNRPARALVREVAGYFTTM